MEQLNVYFKSSATIDMIVEVFNSFNSIAFVNATNLYNNVQTSYAPALSWTAPNGPVSANLNNLSFTANGSLVNTKNTGVLLHQIECMEYPYKSVLAALNGGTKILIHKIRMTTSSNANQLQQSVTKIETIPLTNRYTEINYAVTISPMNVQPLINDWIQPLTIDAKSGLKFNLIAGEILQWTIDFDFI